MVKNIDVKKILKILDKEYPEKKVALKHRNSLELLIATILSAQCTDERVNIVTKGLFRKYKSAKDFADSDINELENEIRSIGLFRSKAKNIKKTCKLLVDEFNGEVPSNMNDLLKLHGVARKTANIVLSNWFGIASGIAVDTHVKRISFRLGLTNHDNPNKIEKDLMYSQQESLDEIEENFGKRYLDENLNDKENPFGLTEFDIEEIDELLNIENDLEEQK